MANRRYNVLIEWDGKSELWVTYVPALDHLSTYGETREEALAHMREAIRGYLEAAEKEEMTIPGSEPDVEIVEVEVAPA